MIPGLRAPVEGGYTRALITYVWQCFRCGKAHTVEQEFLPGSDIPIPKLPEGWLKVNGRLYCPQHKVQMVVLVDGVRQP